MESIFRRELELPGVDLATIAATSCLGVVFSRHWGGEFASPENSRGPVRITWDITIVPGWYDVWAHYASEHPRPVNIELNDAVVLPGALGERTFGDKPAFATWVKQGRIKVSARTCSIALASTGDSFGFVKALRLVPATADDSHANSIVATCFRKLTPVERAGLISTTTSPIRKLLALGTSTSEIIEALTGLVDGVREDLNEPQARQGFRGPLNGQVIRQLIFTQLDKLFCFDAFVETGSYLGTTTEMFATYERPVFSCENQARYYYRAASRCAPMSNVTITLEDSRSFLKSFVNEQGSAFKMPFVYLDAHWYDDLPLPEEIEIIAGAFSDFVIMVDDFCHPKFAYGFDKYPTGIELTLDYLLPRLANRQDLEFLFPVHPEHLETGPRRGTLVIIPKHLCDRVLGSPVPIAPVSAF